MQAVGLHAYAANGLGEEMVNGGLITKEQLAVAEVSQRTFGGDLTQILVKKGFIQEKDALRFFEEGLGFPVVELADLKIPRSVLRLVPFRVAKLFTLIPLKVAGQTLTLAVADPSNIPRIEEEVGCEGYDLKFVMAPRFQIETAIQNYYQVHHIQTSSFASVEILNEQQRPALEEKQSIEEMAASVGTVETVNSILEEAFLEKASDVHIEPQENFLRVRLRIDGLLEERHILNLKMLLPVVSRIKILSGMNIAEKRAPQDGRFSAKIQGETIDCRTSTYPTVHGEKVVVRLLTKKSLIKLEQLGMSAADRELFRHCVLKPHGLILVTGPTGSGKSTTLYSALHLLNSIDRNILSIEDPVENEIPGVNQAQLNTKANITFASALRSMLRQDPDVIMVGEIRDSETAEMALRAALTGHLVLSTLHTNTAIGAVSRLINLGLPPFLVASSLVGTLGQRLVRKICTRCRMVSQDSEERARFLGLGPEIPLYQGMGCEHCRFLGFDGRLGLFELVVIEKNLKKMIEQGASEEKLFEAWRHGGGKLMIEDGKEKVVQGVTTVQEVLKVVEFST